MAKVLSRPGLYDRDFVLWIEEQVRLLREGRLDEADIPNIVEELEDMARSQHRELRSRVRVLVTHLLKCGRQPQKRSKSWDRTIITQRDELAALLEQSPSLHRRVEETAWSAYPAAVEQAALDTGLDAGTFPDELPYDPATLLGDETGARRRSP
jgi:hypothetical protein